MNATYKERKWTSLKLHWASFNYDILIEIFDVVVNY